MVAAWLFGEAYFEFGFLLIFIGLGLLRGSGLQRSLFGGLLALALVGVVVVLAIGLLCEGVYWFRGEGSGPRFAFEGVVVLIILLYSFMVLWHAKSDDWFAEKYSGKAPRYVIPVTVTLGVLFSLISSVEDLQQKRALEEVFPYNLEVRVLDAESGLLIEDPSFETSNGNIHELDLPDWFVGSSFTSRLDREGTRLWEVRGYARKTLTVTIKADGYRGQTIEYSGDAEGRVEVSLERLKY